MIKHNTLVLGLVLEEIGLGARGIHDTLELELYSSTPADCAT